MRSYERFKNTDRIFYFFLLFIVFLTIWSVFITYREHINYLLEYDEGIYLSVARKIHETGFPIEPVGINGEFFLGHPHLAIFELSFWEYLFGVNFVAIRLFHMLTWFLPLAFIIFFFCEKLSNMWGGLLAVFWIISESFILHNAFLTKLDVPLMFMFTLFFFLFYTLYKKNDEKVFRRWFLLGIIFVLATLTKYQALLMIVPVSFVLLKHYYFNRQALEWQKSWMLLSGFILGFLAILIPWFIYCSWGGGEVITVVSSRIHQISHFDPLEYRNTAAVLDYWKILFNRIGFPLIFIFITSLCLVLRLKTFKSDSFILLSVWIVTVFIFFTFISTKSLTGRYFLPLVPPLILLSSKVITEKLSAYLLTICLFLGIIFSVLLQIGNIGLYLYNTKLLLAISVILLIGLILWMFSPYFHLKGFNYCLMGFVAFLIGIQGGTFHPVAVQSKRITPVEIAGDWIRSNTRKGNVVFTNAPQIGYFGDRNYIFSQYDRTGGMSGVLDDKRINVIYLDSHTAEFFDRTLLPDKKRNITEKIKNQFKLVMIKKTGTFPAYLFKRKVESGFHADG